MNWLDREQWSTILERADEPRTYSEIVATVEAVDVIDADAKQVVEDAIDEGDLIEDGDCIYGATYNVSEDDKTPNSGKLNPEEPKYRTAKSGSNPTETAKQNTVERQEAVAALRDVLEFYNRRLDNTIIDHTEDGDHPERPTTAREYFTDIRGWENDTVDELFLGWAPADHLDQLVAYLFDRGHSREAMIATGAIGESDTGGLYATFSGRYVLPYYDDDGEPAYAIARCTGGDGGGAKGYGGHPGDWKAGKYAKLRHTDEKVPFEEPIYGLDTLGQGEHVVVAEGIADAITAREAGYAVLSPVAKEFKDAHYDSLVDAFDAHQVERVTIVADADSIRNASESEIEPESIREAVDLSLSPVGAGLGGALRTASKLGDRNEADVRVSLPPAPADTESDLDEFVTGDWGGDLAALLRSAKPAEAFDELESALSKTTQPAEAFDNFDPEEYEPSTTKADETTTDIRDVFAALNRLDAQRVADRTIVSEWLESSTATNRAFAPSWAPSGYSGTAVYCDSDKFVDTGDRGGKGGPAVMAAIDAGLVRDTQCPDAVRGETWRKAVDHLRDLGFSIPKLETTRNSGEGDTEDEYTEYARDILDLDVVVEPRHALSAAAAVEPDDLDEPLPELEREDIDDVAVAVAVAEGMIDDGTEFPGDGDYTKAYYRARDHYGAPLPEYLDNETLEHREDLVFAALDRVTPYQILDNIQSDITVEDPAGVAIAKINPTWEDSESGERILAGYGSGFYCVEHEVSFSPIQLVALEHGLIDSEYSYPHGGKFRRAYTLLRDKYGAPIPKWRSTLLEHVAVLPPAQRVLNGGFDLAERSREDAHKATEALIRDAAQVHDRGQLINIVAGGGKTFSTAVVADDHPVLYCPPRNDLKKQMEEYAEEIRNDDDIDAAPTVQHLPIFGENRLPEEALEAGAAAVRAADRDLLRDREQLYSIIEPLLPEEGDEEADDEDDTVELDRATCPTAEGEHGEQWRVAVQVARQLENKPADIHRHDERLFGEVLPCKSDGECEYNLGWKEIREPPVADILIGGPAHAFVDSATTYFEIDEDGDRVETPRAVVIDEFPGDAYMQAYSDRYMDHATWAAEALVGIDNREDLLDADLDTDTWVDCWLNGEGDEYGLVADLVEYLRAGRELSDAREAAENVLDRGLLDEIAGVVSTDTDEIRAAVETAQEADPRDAGQILDTLDAPIAELVEKADREYASGDRTRANPLYDAADSLEKITQPLAEARATAPNGKSLTQAAEDALDALRIGGDLRALVEDAISVMSGEEIPDELLEATITALRGGRAGCRELSVVAKDGYAHPDAWTLLAGAIVDTENDAEEVRTDTFAFDRDSENGGTFKRLKKNDVIVAADKNHHGALVVDTPEFADITGAKCPVLGLDATGRPELWRIAIGRDTQQRDIHDSDAERRAFLCDSGLRVVQTTDKPLPYHGSPDGKNFGEDIELVKTAAEQYTGDAEHAIDEKGPAVISTKKVLNQLESVLDDHAGEMVNYENMKGSDALGDHQAAVILGSCHFGDAEPEKWALLAGEDAGRGESKGKDLDYGSEVANTYLRYMREDHTMQAILRAGRNDEDTVVFAHTSALRDDLPVEAEGVVLSAHSKGTLAVAEAAADLGRTFNVDDIVETIDGDERAVGRRQVQNVLAELRESGYIRVVEEGGRGQAYEYEFDEDIGLADVELPTGVTSDSDTNEKTSIESIDTQNFVSEDDEELADTSLPPTTAEIPAAQAADTSATGPPPG